MLIHWDLEKNDGYRGGTKLKGYIGYDYQLHKKISDYPEFEEDCVIFGLSMLDWFYATKRIRYAMNYYDKGKVFPPCDNWEDGDPINLAPFLIYNDWGKGPTDRPLVEDNKYPHLGIIVYELGDKTHRKCVNLHGYINNAADSHKDIFTNKLIKFKSFQEICFGTKKKDIFTTDLIPEFKIEFDE